MYIFPWDGIRQFILMGTAICFFYVSSSDTCTITRRHSFLNGMIRGTPIDVTLGKFCALFSLILEYNVT